MANIPSELIDYGAALIVQGRESFEEWSADMVREFGDEVQPYLEVMFKEAAWLAERLPERLREASLLELARKARGQEDSRPTAPALSRSPAEKVSGQPQETSEEQLVWQEEAEELGLEERRLRQLEGQAMLPASLLFYGLWRLSVGDWSVDAMVLTVGSVATVVGVFLYSLTFDKDSESWSNLWIFTLSGLLPWAFGTYLVLYKGLWGLRALLDGFSLSTVMACLLYIVLGYASVKAMDELTDRKRLLVREASSRDRVVATLGWTPNTLRTVTVSAKIHALLSHTVPTVPFDPRHKQGEVAQRACP